MKARRPPAVAGQNVLKNGPRIVIKMAELQRKLNHSFNKSLMSKSGLKKKGYNLRFGFGKFGLTGLSSTHLRSKHVRDVFMPQDYPASFYCLQIIKKEQVPTSSEQRNTAPSPEGKILHTKDIAGPGYYGPVGTKDHMRGGLNESAGAGVGRWNSWQEQNTRLEGRIF